MAGKGGGGGTSVGALFARLGIDTTDFSRELASATAELSKIKGAASTTGSAMQGSIVPSFGVASLMAQQLAGALREGAKGMADTVGLSPAFTTSITTLGTSALLAAGSYGKLSLTVKDFAKAGPDAALAMGNLVLASGQMGYSLGKLATEFFPGITQGFLNMTGPTKLFADQLAGSQPLFDKTVMFYNKLRDQLNLTGSQWQVQATRTKENAERLAALTDKALALRNELSKVPARATAAHEALKTLATGSLQDLSKTAQAAKSLQEQFQVMSAGQVKVGMMQLVTQFRDLAEQGVSGRQLFEAFKEKVAELVVAARDYKGLNVPKEFKDLAAAVGEGGSVTAVEQLAQSMQTGLPTAISTGSEASKEALAQLERDFAGKISGGFGRGIQEGTNAGKQAIDQFRQDVGNQLWKINFDIEHMQRQIQGAVSGAMARTGGLT